MTTSSIPGCYRPLARHMELAEVGMSTIQRWIQFHSQPPSTSIQSSGAHCYAMTQVASILVHVLRPYVNLDEVRLKRAVEDHDMGEGLLQRDVLYHDKTDEKDAAEYASWLEHIQPFEVYGAELIQQMKEDFLLQFCLTHEHSSAFDDEARQIMQYLKEKYPNEAVAFRVLEYMEYVLYRIRQYCDRNYEAILIEVIDTQLNKVESWGAQLPGFLENLWTPELSAWCRAERAKLNGHSA